MKSTRAGPTENISVSMPTELVSELRSRTGRCGLFSCMTEAVRHQLAMDGLAEPVFGFGFPYPNSGAYLTVSKTTRSVT